MEVQKQVSTDAARAIALQLLQRVDSGGWPNLLLPRYVEELSPRDRAFCTELTFGATRRLGTLDWVASIHLRHKLDSLDAPVKAAIRLGIYQILFMDVPDYAAVDSTTDLVSGRGRGLVNGTLRTIVRERDSIPWPMFDSDPIGYISKVASFPQWMARLLVAELGPHDAKLFVEFCNRPRPIIVRLAHKDADRELRDAGLSVIPTELATGAAIVKGEGRPSSWPGFQEGHFAVADESSILVGEAVIALNPKVVADFCAGPGGKASHLAQHAKLVATEIHAQRAILTKAAIDRMGVSGNAVVVRGNAIRTVIGEAVDTVLLDAPCSGLGVMSRRPDLRWRAEEKRIEELAKLQRDLLRSAAATKTNHIVYSVCTITSRETTDVLDEFLAANPEFSQQKVLPQIPRAHDTDWLQLLGHLHGTDGMFISCLSR